MSTPSFAEALVDPALFGPWFAGPSWAAWRVVARAADGVPLVGDERETFAALSGGRQPPSSPVAELWLVKGRRAGGSLFSAGMAVHAATFSGFGPRLGPGEVATVMLLATDRKQSRVLMRYVTGLLDSSPLLAPLVVSRTAESITLSTRCVIEVHTASFRSVRGYAVALAVADELGYWLDVESGANPSDEVLRALRPALASLGGRLVCVSSPYSRRGPLWEAFARGFGQDDPHRLVVRGTTRALNPTIDEALIARALEQDEASARAEWLAEFRSDVESYISREVLDDCTIPDRRELPPTEGVRYHAFTDPSGGAHDSWTLAIAHAEPSGTVVLDSLDERRPPFSPRVVVESFAHTLRRYRCTTVHGDKYGGQFPVELFRSHGILYRPAEKPKLVIYIEALPLLTSHRVELLDEPRLRAQLLGLERRTGRGTGRDVIDHAPGAHDDVANAVCGALVLAGARPQEAFILDLWTGEQRTLAQEAERRRLADLGLVALHRDV